MSEKAALIAPVPDALAERCAYAGRASKARAVGKFFFVAAAAYVVFYGIPQGQFKMISIFMGG